MVRPDWGMIVSGDDLSSLFADMRAEAMHGSPVNGKSENERGAARREKPKRAARPSPAARKSAADTSDAMECRSSECRSNVSGKCRVTDDVERYRRLVAPGVKAVCPFYNDGEGEIELVD